MKGRRPSSQKLFAVAKFIRRMARRAETLECVIKCNQEKKYSIAPLHEVERAAILRAVELCDGNYKRAAERLQIGERSIHRKLQEYRKGKCKPHGSLAAEVVAR